MLILSLQSCDSDLQDVKTSADASSNVHKIEKIENFVKSLKSETSVRSNETLSLDELEFVVEGAINALHTKAHADDGNSEIISGERKVTFLNTLSSLTEAHEVYNEIRSLLKEEYKKSTIIDKALLWADLEFTSEGMGEFLITWNLKVGEENEGLLLERSEPITSCIFTSPTTYNGFDYASPNVANCAYLNLDYEDPIEVGQYWYDIESDDYNSVSDYNGWHFYCTGNGSPDCFLYFTNSSYNVFTTAGEALAILDHNDLNYEREELEYLANAYKNTGSGFEITNISGSVQLDAGGYDINQIFTFEVTKARLFGGGICCGEGEGGEDL